MGKIGKNTIRMVEQMAIRTKTDESPNKRMQSDASKAGAVDAGR